MKVARIAITSMLVALPLTGCNNADELPPAGSYASVHGTVVDAASHKPIKNATVVVDTVLTQKTDDQGNFTFEKVPSGILDYAVKAPGYSDITASGNADPGKSFIIVASMRQQTTPP